jgi:hypothetical protein
VSSTATASVIAVAPAEDHFMDVIDRSHPVNNGTSAAATGEPVEQGRQPGVDRILPVRSRAVVQRWLLHEIPYIAMLLLALAGVVIRLPVIYWIVLTPVFGIISIIQGWRNFLPRTERLRFLVSVALDWCALLLAIYLLYSSGVQGVMNANASSLGMMILLALGTFVSGVQARVWQICAIGGVLFLAVPGLGWLDQSPLLWTAAACVIVALGGVAWLVTHRGQSSRN